MDITKMTETELKALAYDQVVLLEQTQANIRSINAEILKRREQPKEEA